MRRARYSINLWESPVDAVENIVAGLNETEPRFTQARNLLRELVMKWNQCGRDLNLLFRREPALAARISREWEAFLAPSPDGGACLCITPAADRTRLSSGEGFALYLFMNFLIHRGWQRLGGPCPQCDRYYLKKTLRQRVYCSRTCATNHTAAEAMRKSLDDQRKEKLERAVAEIKKWQQGSKREPWKKFVADRCGGLTLHFLTRAINLGELRPPTQERNQVRRKRRLL